MLGARNWTANRRNAKSPKNFIASIVGAGVAVALAPEL
jgi:hypothetical protein